MAHHPPLGSWPRAAALAALIALCGVQAIGAQVVHGPGIVVEEVTPQSAADDVSMRPGDLILSWARAPVLPANPQAAQGPLRSPFDVADVEIEEAPRGAVTLAGMRGNEPMTWTLARSPLGLATRPALEGEVLALYQEGRDLATKGKAGEAAERWRTAARSAAGRGQPLAALWLVARAASVLAEARSWDLADAAYAEVSKTTDLGPGAVASVLREWAATFGRRGDWARAESGYRQALAAAGERESLSLAATLGALGVVAWRRDDFAGAETHHRRALAIREKLAPGSLEVGSTLADLGNVAWGRGDLDGAQAFYQRSLEVRQTAGPESLAVAASLNSLGMVAGGRGDLGVADDLQRRSLAIKEKLAPGSLTMSSTLLNLAVNAAERGDPDLAEEYALRALPILEKLSPLSSGIVSVLNLLGVVAKDREDFKAAEEHYERALAIAERAAPDSASVGKTLGNLGNLAIERGDFTRAEEHHRRAHALFEKRVPGGMDVASSLIARGEVAMKRGDLEVAERHYGQSLALAERLAPGGLQHAVALNGLGLTYRRAGRLDRAVEMLTRSLETLESQRSRLGGTPETRAGFGAKYADFYHECAETLIEAGRAGDALHVLERSRATSLLALLAERALLFADLPAALAAERKSTAAEYDRVQAQLAQAGAANDSAEVERLVSRLRDLRLKQDEIAIAVRKASPRLASVQYPQPLELTGVRSTLDPGTLYLAYSVGAEASILFVVSPAGAGGPGLSTHSLPVGRKALRQKVEAFRSTIERREASRPEVLAAQARELYDLLVRPAEARISSSERLVISPDGPLHSLPFSALVRKGDSARGTPSYLVEWKALHTVASATVYAQLRNARVASRSMRPLVAFGDPRYPAVATESMDRIADSDVRSLVTRGYRLGALPASREEVDAITKSFPGRAQKYLGEDATEERAKALGPGVGYVHFACHAYLDERLPLNSAVALTIPERPAEGQDNGLLQAWEIFERVRLDADLVALSGCDTGRGKEMGGDGLLGLTRAFHYAGARSVLGSLWAVADESTAMLMKEFYGHLRRGRGRDAALRAAQMTLIRGKTSGKPTPPLDLSHPFHWAGFQLSGDYR